MKHVSRKKRIIYLCGILMILLLSTTTGLFADGEGDEYASMFFATGWALLPPVVTIVLALVTREVYSALFLGVAVGAFMYSDFNILNTIGHII